nr:MAG TPA: hypothetical protein [Caudoviricetes sp.]
MHVTGSCGILPPIPPNSERKHRRSKRCFRYAFSFSRS